MIKKFAIGTVSLILLIIIIIIIYKENQYSQIIPLVFSEISQIKREQGTNLGAITEYYAMINDACMKVFEAHNLAQDSLDYEKKFASELEIHIEPTFKTHRHNLPILLTNISPVAEKALNKLQELNVITELTGDISSDLENAWIDEHEDVYHTEIYTYTTTDEKGNTTTHTGTRQVYDYTIHTYYFKKEYSERAKAKLVDMLSKYVALTMPEKIYTSKITHAEGEYATEKSFKHYNKKFTVQDAVKKITTWADGTTYNINMPKILTTYPAIGQYINTYISSLSTSRYHRYKTYSSSDDGPKEFQINEHMGNINQNISTWGKQIIYPIKKMHTEAIPFYETINGYVDYSLNNNNKKINSGMVINKTKQIYSEHFNGNSINTFNFLMVFIKIIVTLAIGAGIIFVIYNWEEIRRII